jgi:hypothetical protein
VGGKPTRFWWRIPVVRTGRLPVVGRVRPVDFEGKARRLVLELPVPCHLPAAQVRASLSLQEAAGSSGGGAPIGDQALACRKGLSGGARRRDLAPGGREAPARYRMPLYEARRRLSGHFCCWLHMTLDTLALRGRRTGGHREKPEPERHRQVSQQLGLTTGRFLRCPEVRGPARLWRCPKTQQLRSETGEEFRDAELRQSETQALGRSSAAGGGPQKGPIDRDVASYVLVLGAKPSLSNAKQCHREVRFRRIAGACAKSTTWRVSLVR